MVKLHADWPVPDNIVAFTSCRSGGISQAPFNSLNLGAHVGDSLQAVTTNRELLQGSCVGLKSTQWLNQVHGNRVILAGIDGSPDADACYTRERGLACAVMTADCLPVLFCDEQGQQVACAHAGWRSLLTGIIENTAKTFSCAAKKLLVWLGPAIGQQHFEVGQEVLQAFVDASPQAVRSQIEQAFVPNSQRSSYYFADLYQLARIRLTLLGIERVYGGEYCCYSDQQRFFSYRRDTTTGRMVSLIYKCVE
ncbi:MAG: peptidoglycan editing factor PgeF [Spongiibacteraceae bacterium]|nr:peptidoglycan editing factor PgeF [Spongiibacteraceae bacterium]